MEVSDISIPDPLNSAGDRVLLLNKVTQNVSDMTLRSNEAQGVQHLLGWWKYKH